MSLRFLRDEDCLEIRNLLSEFKLPIIDSTGQSSQGQSSGGQTWSASTSQPSNSLFSHQYRDLTPATTFEHSSSPTYPHPGPVSQLPHAYEQQSLATLGPGTDVRSELANMFQETPKSSTANSRARPSGAKKAATAGPMEPPRLPLPAHGDEHISEPVQNRRKRPLTSTSTAQDQLRRSHRIAARHDQQPDVLQSNAASLLPLQEPQLVPQPVPQIEPQPVVKHTAKPAARQVSTQRRTGAIPSRPASKGSAPANRTAALKCRAKDARLNPVQNPVDILPAPAPVPAPVEPPITPAHPASGTLQPKAKSRARAPARPRAPAKRSCTARSTAVPPATTRVEAPPPPHALGEPARPQQPGADDDITPISRWISEAAAAFADEAHPHQPMMAAEGVLRAPQPPPPPVPAVYLSQTLSESAPTLPPPRARELLSVDDLDTAIDRWMRESNQLKDIEARVDRRFRAWVDQVHKALNSLANFSPPE
ncbi:MAG: hypothetical protein M1825_005501 [Sarcosagium campestre]|nr:MAG: hypothetical protein M1825_005501 [Sarcosagium campestre]